MKKLSITTIVLCLIAAGLALGAAVTPPKYWKSVMQVKPSVEWLEAYGWGDESFLAHGQWVNRQVLDNFIKVQADAMASLKTKMDGFEARLKALEPVDPNEVKE